MKKFGALLALAATLLVSAPVRADEEALDMVTQGSLMFTRVGGMGAGLVVGTPIAIVRESVKSYIDLTQGAADSVGESMGGKDSGPVCLVVSFVTLPAGLLVGGAKGLYYGTRNGVVSGFNTPFHSDSFSLGELEGE